MEHPDSINSTPKVPLSKALLTDRLLLQQFLSALPVGAAVIENGKCSYLNQVGRALLGKELLPDLAIAEFAAVYQIYRAGTNDLYPANELPISQTFKGKSVIVDDLEIRRDGKVIPLEVRTMPVCDAQGEVIYALHTFHELSHRWQQTDDRLQTAIALHENEVKFRRLAENVPGVIYRYVLHPDHSDEMTYISPRIYDLQEQEPEAILQDVRLIFALVHPDDIQGLRDGILASAQTLQPWRWEGRLITPSGRLKWVQGFSHPEQESNGDVVWDGLLIDITERKQAEIALQESESRFRRLAENVPGMIYRYILHADGINEFTYVSPYCREIYELEAEVMRQNIQLLGLAVHPDDRLRVQSTIAKALQSSQPINLEHRIVTPSGQIKWIQVIAQPEILANGDSVWDGVSIDITDRKFAEQLLADYNCTLEQQVQARTLELQQEIMERKRAEAIAKDAEAALRQANWELERLASLDSLTQVANRRRFDEYFAHEWQEMQREHKPLALILCDVDYFKYYNDRYGHQEGDRCLQRLAETMRRVVKRSIDLVSRYGGEEFAMILPNTDLNGAMYIAEEIRSAIWQLEVPHDRSEVSPFVTISLGVTSLIPMPDLSPEVLLTAADQALYQAKRQGRNCAISSSHPQGVAGLVN